MKAPAPRAAAVALASALLIAAAARVAPQADRRYEVPVRLWSELAADTVTDATFNIRRPVPPHIRFTEVSRAAGTTLPGNTRFLQAVDVNGDRRTDLYECNSPIPDGAAPGRLYINEGGGRFRPLAPPGLPPYTDKCEFADLDGDGQADLVAMCLRLMPRSSHYYYRFQPDSSAGNQYDTSPVSVAPPSLGVFLGRGDGSFREVTADWAPDVPPDARCHSLATADWTGDGRPDLALALQPPGAPIEIRIYRGNGSRFVLAESRRSPLRVRDGSDLEESPRLCWSDWNGDGRPELFLHQNVAYWQPEQRVFIATVAGDRLGPFRTGPVPDVPSLTDPAWCDYDRDGRPDAFIGVSDYWGGRNALLHNDGASFSDRGRAAGLWAGYDYTWRSAWGDCDADGWPELFQPRSHAEGRPTTSALYLNLRDGTFANITPALQPPPGPACYGAAWLDADGDGDLDLAVARGTDYLQFVGWEQTGLLLYRNDVPAVPDAAR